MYGRNSDKGGDLTDVGARAIGSAINKEFNLMDAGCRPLHTAEKPSTIDELPVYR